MAISKNNEEKTLHGINCSCGNCSMTKSIIKKNEETLKELKRKKEKKLKDLPRYSVVSGYETAMKRDYVNGITEVIKKVLNQRKKIMKDDFES